MPDPKRAKIVVVDDHPLFLEGIVSLIRSEPDFEVAATATTATAAMELIGSLLPDLVISDLSLPDKNGLDLLKDLKASHPLIPVLVISMHDENVYAERVLRAGGRGYIMKEASPDKLSQAIRQVLHGGIYVSTQASSRFLQDMALEKPAQYHFPLRRLSDRELEIFELIGQGSNNQEIAERLGISTRTVDAHRCNIRKKLNLPGGNILVTYAVKWFESGRLP